MIKTLEKAKEIGGKDELRLYAAALAIEELVNQTGA